MGSMTAYRKGEIVFRQGDPSIHMYDIRVGSVGIYMEYGTDREQQLTILKKGDFFGEMGMIESHTRSATAVALEENTIVTAITIGDFAAYFREEPEKLLAIMNNMSLRIRSLTQDYLDVCRTALEMSEGEEAGEEANGWLKQSIRKIFADYDHLSRQKHYGRDVAR